MTRVREIRAWSIRGDGPVNAEGNFFPFLRFDAEWMIGVSPTGRELHFSRDEFIPSSDACTFEDAVESLKVWVQK